MIYSHIDIYNHNFIFLFCLIFYGNNIIIIIIRLIAGS